MSSNRSSQELRQRLRDLELELVAVRRELASVAPDEQMSGLQTLVEGGGARCVLSANKILEIGPLVQFSPIPGAPPYVLGTFVGRGIPTLAIHLKSLLEGVALVPAWQSKLILIHGSKRIALVADHVTALPNAPLLSSSDESDSAAAEPWRKANVLGGFCRVGSDILPVLQIEPVIEALHGLIP